LLEFASGHQPLLVATDAAGEGLNLHHACRIVINLELPWNPIRLAQRIGRVDRIGQKRAVHAFHLIARGTGEERVLERLRARIGRARLEMGLADPLGDNEQETARFVVDGTTSQALPAASDRVALWSVPESPSLGPDALVETGRLSAVRMLRGGDGTRRFEPEGPLAIASRKRSVRAALAGRVLLVWQVALEDASGSQVESTVIGTAITTTGPVPRRRDRRWLDGLIEAVANDAAQRAVAAASTWRTEAFRIAEAFMATRMRRERAIAACAGDDAASRFQPGLFDQRADRARQTALAIERDANEIASSRLASLERAGILSCPPPNLLLVLVS